MKNLILLVGLLGLLPTAACADPPTRPVCLYVSSYHPGYHWNDGVEAGLMKNLGQACELKRFYMDTLRNKAPEFAAAQGAEAKKLIDALHPDVVIACDDPASKYLVMPYLKNAAIPVVFCGVNWSVEPYGYPYRNVTGMIEVTPLQPLLQEARAMLPNARQLAFLTADVLTQRKEAEQLKKVAADNGFTLSAQFVSDLQAWRKGFDQAQSADLVILGNPTGISGWDEAVARQFLQEHTRRLTLSFGVVMSRLVVFAMTNVPEEQGEWSAELARLILSGEAPAHLPITANRRWQMFVNLDLAGKVGVRVPERILQHAILVESPASGVTP